jgi:hypothetical protein
MSSVLSAVSQIPRSSSGFIVVGSASANNARFFSEAEFATAIASANATVSGTQVYFNTNANAISALVVAGGDVRAQLFQFQAFKDLGKNYHIYVPSDTAGAIQQIWCVFTKVRRIGSAAASADWEGDNGLVGYICTYSSAQTNNTTTDGSISSTEPICVVARTGFGHGF